VSFVSPRPSIFALGNTEVEEKQNSLFPEGPVIKCYTSRLKYRKKRRPRKNDLLDAYEGCAYITNGSQNELYYRNDTIIVSFFVVTRQYLNCFAFLQMLNSRNLGLTWRGKSYFLVKDTAIFLPGECRQRSMCELPNASDPFFSAKLKAWRHKMFEFSSLKCFFAQL